MSQTQTMNDVQAVADAIRSNDRFLVVTHENPDGDALGSMLAVTLVLRALQKDVAMFLSGTAPTPGEYRFLELDGLLR
jgi:phosphoesterase RecJ-like protein